jgi:DNA-binding NarL/FixJ family response regulator
MPDTIRVVLADDHATIREALKLLCDAQPDIEVIGEAADGVEAVEAAARLRPDVLLMDVTMPRMNGLRATALVKARAPTVRVITLTRHSEPSYVRELLAAGASGYALKQSSSTELLGAIRSVAAGRSYVDQGLTANLMKSYVQGRGPRGAPEPSPRETEVLQLIAWGYSNKQIAERLGLSVKTVEVHKANAMKKLGMKSRIEVVRFAVLKGWLQET